MYVRASIFCKQICMYSIVLCFHYTEKLFSEYTRIYTCSEAEKHLGEMRFYYESSVYLNSTYLLSFLNCFCTQIFNGESHETEHR